LLAKTSPECSNDIDRVLGRSTAQESSQWLLRVRRERPRRRAAQERDELAPPHASLQAQETAS
jgi:hypothetical protein